MGATSARRRAGPSLGSALAEGWRPLRSGRRGVGGPVGGFTRLARAHACVAAGDTLIALALAGSLFFSLSPDAARPKVALYLLLTVAPFAVVAPLIGPLIDRQAGGRRTMVLVAAAARAVVCLLMIDDLDGLLLFPEAFAALVLGKAHNVARASLVPGLVRDTEQLVQANSKLVLVSGVVGFAAAVPGVALLQLGPGWVLAVAAAMFVAGTLAAFRIPATTVAESGPDAAERSELRGAQVVLAASAMALLRGIVGFLAFLLIFALRADDAPTWWFGVVLAASAGGSVLGAALAPSLRRSVREERVLLGCLGAVSVGGVTALLVGGRAGAAVLAAVVGLSASAGKLCFDSIVQRDAPDANQGRSFARFETRFQLAWVAGAFFPVVLPLPLAVGLVAVAVLAGLGAACYATGRRLGAELQPLLARGARPVATRLVSARAARAEAREARRSPPPPPPQMST